MPSQTAPRVIAVDARSLDGTKNGYAAYTEWVVSALQAQGYEVHLISNHRIDLAPYHRIKPCQTKVFGSHRSYVWEQRDVRRYIHEARPTAYVCGQNIGLPLGYGKLTRHDTRLVLGILDMIPQRFAAHYIVSWRDKLRYQWLQRANARAADQIITISKASQRDIKRYMGVKQVRSVYIRQVEPPAKQRSGAGSPTFVYMGGVEWRKRVDVAVAALGIVLVKHPDAKLYLIGKGYEAIVAAAPSEVQAAIIQPGVLPETKRNRIIQNASAVLAPSLYEGYGLPIAEGLLHHVPVICGRDGAQREVGGDAALYIDPSDEKALAQAMLQTLTPAYQKTFKAVVQKQIDFLCDPELDKKLVQAIVGDQV
jgi:glycosyltransferase involved in cell wall biosynthesis